MICRKGPFRKFLLKHPFILERFLPTVWCCTSNLQSLVAVLFQEYLPEISYSREILTLSDGGICALDWVDEGTAPSSPTVLFVHGLTGDSQSYYMKTVVPMIRNTGCRCVVFNQRGTGGVPLKTYRVQSCLNTDDLAEVLSSIKSRHPSAPVFAVGYSQGGLVLTLYLTEKGGVSLIDAVLAISTPKNLHEASISLHKFGPNLVLNRYLASYQVDAVRRNRTILQGKVNVDKILQCKTIREFDAVCTAPIMGFSSVDDYYEASSIRGKLGTVRRPLLYLTSSDDIFAVEEAMPVEEMERSAYIAAVVLPRGGHLGFVDGLLWPRLPFYAERFAFKYITALLEYSRINSVKDIPTDTTV